MQHAWQDYDERGDYIRTWVPELAKVPAPSLFEPWRLSREDQAKFGVQIGVSLVCKAPWASPLLSRRPAPREVHMFGMRDMPMACLSWWYHWSGHAEF